MIKTKTKQEAKAGGKPTAMTVKDELRRIMAEMDCAFISYQSWLTGGH